MQIDVTDGSREDYLKYDLIPYLRDDLAVDGIDQFSDNMLAAVGAAIRTVQSTPASHRSYENIVPRFMQNALLEAFPQVTRVGDVTEIGSNLFDFEDYSPDALFSKVSEKRYRLLSWKADTSLG